MESYFSPRKAGAGAGDIFLSGDREWGPQPCPVAISSMRVKITDYVQTAI